MDKQDDALGYGSVNNNLFNDNLAAYCSNSDLNDNLNSGADSDNPSSELGSYELGEEDIASVSSESGEVTATGSNSKTTSIVSTTTKVVTKEIYSVTLKDEGGNPLSGKNLIFTFNGKNYNRTTGSDGMAKLPISAKPSNYLISVVFEGDNLYSASSISENITVTKIPTTIVNSTNSAINGKSYSVALKDKNGNALASKTVIIKFNGKTYNVATNSNGLASFTISGTVAKTYTLTYRFAGDSYYAASSGTKSLKVKMPTTLIGSGSTIVKGNAYKVTLKDGNGKVISSKTITFNFNGRVYNRTTNSKGIASLTINTVPGKYYNLAYSYDGTSYYAGYSKKVSLFVKTPTQLRNSGNSVGQGRIYYINLKDSDGNALSNKTVKLTYRGKTYNKITNSRGDVGLRINNPIGNSYTLNYNFAGDSHYGPSSGSVNIRIKKGTNLIGPSSTVIVKGNDYKVTLKDDDGNVLSGQKITFTFNGNVYSRTTNSKGVANLTITATAGKTYKLSYKFGGTSYYNGSSSSTINLAVKVKSAFKNSGSVIMNNTIYNVTLKDSDGNLLANKLVNFTFDGKTYQKKTNADGIVGLLINVTGPKTAKLTYMFDGDSIYEPSSGSVSLDVKSDKIFTFKHIVAASVLLRDYVEKNHKLPSTVTVNGVKVNMAVFAYLLGKSVENIYYNRTSNVAVVDVNSTYQNNGNSSINADLNKVGYTVAAKNFTSYIVNNKRLPYLINTNIGSLSPNLLIFGLAKALDFYSNMNRLPNYVTFNAKDVNGGGNVTAKGNASQYKKGLNEVQALNSTQIATYLQSGGNDALNAAIKELANNLTKGKTTVWAKANAIFNWVRDNIDYEYYANTKYKATGTLANKKGNCCDHANLIVALCRAADIPARYSHGKNCKFSSGLNTGHVWAQIYIDGVWYSADATTKRNELGNIKNWNTNSFTLHGYDIVHLTF